MVKFASALGIGPLFHNDYIYDILVLKTHYEYLMERCEIPSIFKETNKLTDIKNALATMHDFKAVHMDIKPENISYSLHHHKFVLLDFGFSEFIR